MLNVVLYKELLLRNPSQFPCKCHVPHRYTMYNGMEPHNFASIATQAIYFLLELIPKMERC